MFKFNFLGLAIAMLISLGTVAQINIGGTPFSLSDEAKQTQVNKQAVPTITLKKPDIEKAKLEDANSRMTRGALGIQTNLTMDNSGVWTELENGDRIWRLSISAPGASTISASMENFYLPEGTLLYLYDNYQNQIRGGFSSFNNKESGSFVFSPIVGDNFTLEYYQPKEIKEKATFKIKNVSYGYQSNSDFDNAKSMCTAANVTCHIPLFTDEWYNQIGVVRITMPDANGNQFFCSGSLINSVGNSTQNSVAYVLTADHCRCLIDTDLNDWIFDFKYLDNCDGGPYDAFVSLTGCNLTAASPSTDGLLVRIQGDIPTNLETYYNGWDRSGDMPVNNETICIHHIGGDYKKISNGAAVGDITLEEVLVDATCGTAATDSGVELDFDERLGGGSSGAPLFDYADERKIIGYVNSGPSGGSCTDVVFGRFSAAWNDFSTSLCPPGTTCPTTLDGLYDNVPASGGGCRVGSLKSVDKLTMGKMAEMIDSDLNNNFVQAQNAFIKHEKEIMSLLESEQNTRLNSLYKQVKKEGYKLFLYTFAYNKAVQITEEQYLLFNDLLSALKQASRSKSLIQEINNVQQHLAVVVDKEVKTALLDFDQSRTEVAYKTTAQDQLTNATKILNNLSSSATLLFQSAYEQGSLSINLYDVNGVKVQSIANQASLENGSFQYQIDKSNLANGVYLIQVQYSNEQNQYQETLKLPVFK